MKIYLLILCLLFSGCSTPPEPQETSGKFVIRQFSEAGNVVKSYETTSYHETDFPRSVTFNHQGRYITLEGSYQIDEFLTK